MAWVNRDHRLAQIEPLGVARSREGQGIGMALLQELELRLHEDGLEKLIVETDVDRERALGIYGKHGFLETHRILVFRKDQGPSRPPKA